MRDEESEIKRIQEIYETLETLDKKSVRSLRALVTGTATDEDKDMLLGIEMKMIDLRAELAKLLAE